MHRELEIPTPATHYPENLGQLAELDSATPPFAIKPAIKEHFFYATKAKAWRANSHAELRTLFQKASDLAGDGEIMVQELIPGGGTQQFSYCAFFRDGEAVGKMVVRRTRQHPLEFGRASTYVETVDIPVLEELSERFLREIDYYGLVELEYKLDPRDSQYKLLDVNARTWGYHSLGARRRRGLQLHALRGSSWPSRASLQRPRRSGVGTLNYRPSCCGDGNSQRGYRLEELFPLDEELQCGSSVQPQRTLFPAWPK